MIAIKRDKQKINNFLIGLLLASKIITSLIGLSTILYSVLIILFVINNFERKVKVKYLICDVFFIFISIYFVLDYKIYGFNTYKNDLVYKLIWYIVIAITFIRADIQPDKVSNISIVIYIIFLPIFYKIDFKNADPGNLMTYSYLVLPMIIITIIKIFVLKIKNKKEWLLILLELPYLYFIFEYASRNIYLISIICLIICLIKNKKSIHKFIIIAISIIALILIYQNALNILKSCQMQLAKYDLSFKIIDKNIKLIEQDDITNGRTDLYNLAIRDISNEPLTGNGIARFKINYDTYPHNLFLQILYEGGIILFAIFIIPILYGIYLIIFDLKKNQGNDFMLIFLFCNSIMRLMISYQYWEEMFFWMYISLSIYIGINKHIEKEKKKNDYCYNTNIQSK